MTRSCLIVLERIRLTPIPPQLVEAAEITMVGMMAVTTADTMVGMMAGPTVVILVEMTAVLVGLMEAAEMMSAPEVPAVMATMARPGAHKQMLPA